MTGRRDPPCRVPCMSMKKTIPPRGLGSRIRSRALFPGAVPVLGPPGAAIAELNRRGTVVHEAREVPLSRCAGDSDLARDLRGPARGAGPPEYVEHGSLGCRARLSRTGFARVEDAERTLDRLLVEGVARRQNRSITGVRPQPLFEEVRAEWLDEVAESAPTERLLHGGDVGGGADDEHVDVEPAKHVEPV